jgi:hypothetical protein
MKLIRVIKFDRKNGEEMFVRLISIASFFGEKMVALCVPDDMTAPTNASVDAECILPVD